MCDETQKNVQIIQDSIDLLNRVIGNLSQVIELEKNPELKRKLKHQAKTELAETLQKHFK